MSVNLSAVRYDIDRYGAAYTAESLPELLENDPMLKHALMQFRTAEYTLQKRLADLVDEWESNYD